MACSHDIVIIGCGRLGSILANHLSKNGHKVVVIDRYMTAFDKLTSDFSGYQVVGNAVEYHVLKEVQINQADTLFATTTSDNTNLMIAQVAKKIFHVPRVVARVYDPSREDVYRQFGVETISPTQLSAQAFLKVME